jgi:hypothetical protein
MGGPRRSGRRVHGWRHAPQAVGPGILPLPSLDHRPLRPVGPPAVCRSLNDNRSLCEPLVFVGDRIWPAGCDISKPQIVIEWYSALGIARPGLGFPPSDLPHERDLPRREVEPRRGFTASRPLQVPRLKRPS